VHPLVLELTGKNSPQTGLEGKFSVYHAAALGIVEGAAGTKQFSDRLARDPAIVGLRNRVTAAIDPAIQEEQVRVIVTLKNGRKLEKFIEHAVGSPQSPMSDAALEAKFMDLADGVLATERARNLRDLCRRAEQLPAAAELAKAATV